MVAHSICCTLTKETGQNLLWVPVWAPRPFLEVSVHSSHYQLSLCPALCRAEGNKPEPAPHLKDFTGYWPNMVKSRIQRIHLDLHCPWPVYPLQVGIP